ncbi:MAG: hypothetical protein KF865_06520 [Bdellovibrionaceae bacterium]|nr:hypothetical protein [Pseudobdellovibrionaceae bacterium]
MKNAKPKLGALVAAAIMGACAVATADGKASETFIPLESLTPQERIALQPRIELLDKYVKIDWQNVLVGLNEKGELVLRDKNAVEMQRVAEPTCWASPQ